ncbi:MAG TPA: hypothetical protein VII38_22240 [Polyangia bacterium]
MGKRGPAAAALLLVLGAAPLARAGGPPSGAHPRFLLGTRKAGLMAQATAPEIASAIKACSSQTGAPIGAGYQGWDWAGQMSSCAIAWLATGTASYATQAVTYWRALLDDNQAVGDGGGGATGYNGGPIVSQDDGYSMRTYGAYGALGLDWLYDAPGVDDTLRSHARDRIVTWHDWYAASGYLNTTPASNYFAGYFLATWAGAIAVGADDPRGAALWTAANQLTDQYVRPAMQGAPFSGGDWIEGWEYGELAVQSYLVASLAASENGVAPFADGLARDTVLFHLYALRPDGSFFDAGDHQDHPVQAGSDSMWGALLAAPASNVAGYAEEYLTKVDHDPTSPWVRALARASVTSWAPVDWTTANLPLSYYAAGSGVMLTRSGWDAGGTWASIQASGRFGADHQHCDAGHFELARGADALAITSADYGTWASWNNNTLLFDDGGRNSTYSPNQGAWGDPSKIGLLHPTEVGIASCAEASFGGAYASSSGGNSVERALRDVIFLRPDVLVVSDRDAVDQSSVKATFLLHTSTAPAISGADLTAEVGRSRLTSRTLLPASPARTLVNEPAANAGSAPWSNNDSYAPDFRAEETETGATTASFVHVLTAGPTQTAAAESTLTVASGARIIHVAGDPARVAVVPDAVDSRLTLPLTYEVPNDPHQDEVVFGLPGSAFSLAVTDGGSTCTVTLTAGADPNVTSADATAAFHLDGCAIGTPPAPPMMIPDGGAAPPRSDGGIPDDPGTGASPGCACSIGSTMPLGSAAGLAGLAFILLLAGVLRRARRH